jgi:cysteine synthase A
VEPKDCAVLSGISNAEHDLTGIGAGFVGDNYNSTFVDAVMSVESESAHELVEIMALKEGIRVGSSAGAALAAARELSGRPENIGKTIVVVVPSFA